MSDDNQAQVLVVDDNEMNRDMLTRRLERQGYMVDVAENGVRALELIEERPYDLILLDIMMPKMNGYEVLERLKADERRRHIPVIMISAVDDLDSVVKCIELGAEDYLFKPFNPVLLKARVNASLDKKRTRDRREAETGAGRLMPEITLALEYAQRLASGEAGGLSAEQASLLEPLLTALQRAQTMLS